MNLSPAQQENVLRVTIAAQERAAQRGQPFEMTPEDVADLMADTGGLDDPAYLLPAGLVGKW